jgi:hypothetical protein
MPPMRTRQLVRSLIRQTPNPERRYINDRGTLITIAVKAHHDGLRDERVRRSELRIGRFENDAQNAISVAQRPTGYSGEADRVERLRRNKFADKAKASLAAAWSEVKTAKRVVSERNNRGEVCVVHVSPVKTPRAWPNALPGGTSPRRAYKVAGFGIPPIVTYG